MTPILLLACTPDEAADAPDTTDTTAPTVAITPEEPREHDVLTCAVVDDVANDAEYTFAWTVDGATAGEGAELSPDAFVVGSEVSCTATPTDDRPAGSDTVIVDEACMSIAFHPKKFLSDAMILDSPGADFDLGVDPQAALTAELWVRFEELNGSTAGLLWRHPKVSASSAWVDWGVLYSDADKQLMFGTGLSSKDECTYQRADWEPVVDQWYHIAVTYQATSKSQSNKAIFVDGTLVGECQASHKNPAAEQDSVLLVGAVTSAWDDKEQWRSSKFAFPGTIDEVRISDVVRYDKSGFSPVVYAAVDDDTVGLWHFNEGQGFYAYDEVNGREMHSSWSDYPHDDKDPTRWSTTSACDAEQ